jgi:uncharacterized protein
VALSRDDRKIFVATGYGTEAYLPDGKVGAILDRDAVPLLRRNQFSAALSALDTTLVSESATQFGVTLTGLPERAVEKSRGSGIATLIGLAIVVLLSMRFPWLLLWFGGFGGGGWGRRGGRGGDDDGGGFGGFGGGGFGGGGAGRDF